MFQKINIPKLGFMLFFCSPFFLHAQQNISLNDLSFWKVNNKANWQIAGDVNADLTISEAMSTSPGTGVLVNLPNKENRANLISTQEFGDVDVSFDFMMAKHSNSGFYLQGRYEVQLLDSWGVLNPGTGDCGGIYKRRKFIPQEYLYEGHAPRINACLAPGLWQHMEISFQAPKFDAKGQKISNAKVLLIKLNGAVIQENVELTGPTGGPISETEAALGPFMIQGDHGAVAFKNLNIKGFTGKEVKMSAVDYQVYLGEFKNAKDFIGKKANTSGKIDKLTWEVSPQENNLAEIFKTTLEVPVAGKHQFEFIVAGNSIVNINGKEVLSNQWRDNSNKRTIEIDLPAGNVPVEIISYKTDGWLRPALGMWIQGPEFRSKAYHSVSSLLGANASDPILLDAKTNTVFRSFTDLIKNGKKIKRIVHGVNVGSPSNLHYTYNLDNGSIVQIWKGEFLDTSPMWDDRGDGSSKARGAILTLNDAATFIGTENKDQIEESIPEKDNFKTLGYEVDENDLPTFHYQMQGAKVDDQIRVKENKILERTLSISNFNNNQVIRLAMGEEIISLGNDLYALDGKKYFIKATNASISGSGSMKVLSTPASAKITYEILW